jgi:hypothetical protein
MTILATLSNNRTQIASRYLDVPAFASQRSLVRKAKQAFNIKGKSIVTVSPDDSYLIIKVHGQTCVICVDLPTNQDEEL